ncbi:MAG: Gfo/Idh/MocA family oxidoreductase [Balneolaceae bacterium]|nr:Gfo/Idh/MocA family oxidoreductase [Balneolaceae bacterium]
MNRKEFLSRSSKIVAASGAATLVPGSAFSILGSRNPNEDVVVGLIGCNSMGWSNLSMFLQESNVRCAALCDVDENVLNRRARDVEQMAGNKPDLYRDYRALLERQDIDAVIIGTPDHWHCLPLVEACQSGKDAYCEKPLGRTIAECQVMEQAARKYDRIVQVGQWQRSGPHWKNALAYLESGDLGKIRITKAWAYLGWFTPPPKKENQPAPEGVNYNMWLGPAPERPFNPNRFHFHWRWYWDYAGGLMTDWGVHLIDIILLGMGVKQPNSVMATGGMTGFPDRGMETPDTQQAIYEFDDFSMIWEHAIGIEKGPYGRDHGVAFIGENGTLVIDRQGWQVIPETEDDKNLVPPQKREKGPEEDLKLHVRDFLSSMKSREKPACDIAEASNTAINASLGNIAFRTGDKVRWDRQNNRFVDNPEADKLITPNYRDPWSFPAV